MEMGIAVIRQVFALTLFGGFGAGRDHARKTAWKTVTKAEIQPAPINRSTVKS